MNSSRAVIQVCYISFSLIYKELLQLHRQINTNILFIVSGNLSVDLKIM